MIILLILAILILAFIIIGFGLIATGSEGGVFLILVGLAISCFPISSIYDHVSDLATVREGKLLIEIREDAVKEIDKQLQTIKISQTALMNGDSPVSSLITTKAKFIEDLAQAKIHIAEAKISIEKRSLGLMSGIVTIWGKK